MEEFAPIDDNSGTRFSEHLKRESRRMTCRLISITLFCLRKGCLLGLLFIKYCVLPGSPFHIMVLRAWPDSLSQCPHQNFQGNWCLGFLCSSYSVAPILYLASFTYFLLSLFYQYGHDTDSFCFFVSCPILQAQGKADSRQNSIMDMLLGMLIFKASPVTCNIIEAFSVAVFLHPAFSSSVSQPAICSCPPPIFMSSALTVTLLGCPWKGASFFLTFFGRAN